MHSKINKILIIVILYSVSFLGFVQKAQAQTCTPEICLAANCESGSIYSSSLKDMSDAISDKINEVYDNVMTAVDNMDSRVSDAIMTFSGIDTFSSEKNSAKLIKAKEAIFQAERRFLREEKTYQHMQISNPGAAFKQEMLLKTFMPGTQVLTRAVRQNLYNDHTVRTELMHEKYYTDKDNLVDRSYSQGTISGIAKLYATHKDFFCNAAGANKPADCGEEAFDQGVEMGDQMFEIYLGEGTWPREQVQKSIELMQFYLGINPPDLPNTSDFSSGEGQRAYLNYQQRLAKNNFLTYMLSYLAAKRAPTNEAQTAIANVQKESAGCEVISDGNKNLCKSYDANIVVQQNKASMAEMNRTMYFDRLMNASFLGKTVSGTMGLEKDRTLMMADSLRQDYDAYQMDKMITGALAGYYAGMVGE
jgi:hypothetical protein